MAPEMNRREFLAATPATLALAGHALSQSPSPAAASGLSRAKIETFDYQSVRLRPSRWKEQVDQARAFYLSISNDDILHGHREAAGLPAPGAQLGGWCGRNSNTVFGQWLSGMSRLSRATGDAQLRDKAIALLGEYTKTLKADGDTGMRHYPFDKLVCGLVDLQIYADHAPAAGVLERVTAFASRTFDRSNNLADPTHNTAYYGEPHQIANETPANRPSARTDRSSFNPRAASTTQNLRACEHLPCAPVVRTCRAHLSCAPAVRTCREHPLAHLVQNNHDGPRKREGTCASIVEESRRCTAPAKAKRNPAATEHLQSQIHAAGAAVVGRLRRLSERRRRDVGRARGSPANSLPGGSPTTPPYDELSLVLRTRALMGS